MTDYDRANLWLEKALALELGNAIIIDQVVAALAGYICKLRHFYLPCFHAICSLQEGKGARRRRYAEGAIDKRFTTT